MLEIKRLHVGKRLSEVAIHNHTVYLAGQIAEDTTADIRGQTAQVLAMIDKLLAEAGSDKTCILMTSFIFRPRPSSVFTIDLKTDTVWVLVSP